MRIITGERGWGKTTALVEWMLEDPDRRRIVTASARDARNVLKVVRRVVLSRGLPWTPDTTGWADSAVVSVENGVGVSHLRGLLPPGAEVAVDDVDAVLAELLRTDVAVATATSWSSR